MVLSRLQERLLSVGDSDYAGTRCGRELFTLCPIEISPSSAIFSRGDMRVLIDIPINAQTDLDNIARVIEKVNQASLKDYPEILQEPDILGPQLEENSQFVFRVSMMVQSGTQTKIYHSFYRLYHEALLKEGIDLPN